LPINEDETKINMEEYFGEDYEDYPEEYLPYQARTPANTYVSHCSSDWG
jgi:hypothetical protein